MSNKLTIINYAKKLSVLSPLLIYFAVFFVTSSVGAETKTNLGEIIPCEGNTCGICDIFKLISNVINFALFKLASPLAGIIIAYGGIMMIVSGGKESKRAKGMEAIRYAVLGIFIAFGAWVIVNAIIGGLSGNSLSSSWYKFSGCK